MTKPKKKLNLTINEDILSKAKQLLEGRSQSLSGLVEEFLARLVSDAEISTEGDWLDGFHQRYLKGGYTEPSDSDIEKLLQERLDGGK